MKTVKLTTDALIGTYKLSEKTTIAMGQLPNFMSREQGLMVGGHADRRWDDWARFDNITSRPGSDFAWQVNTAFNVQGNPDIYLGIVESSFEGDGWNLYASGYYRDSDEEFDGVGGEDLGFVLQGGLWIARHFEAYSRYDFTRPDRDRPDEGDGFRTLLGGLSYYPRPESDNIRFQAELMYTFDPEAESLVQPGTTTSVRASPDGGQWVFRTQASLRW